MAEPRLDVEGLDVRIGAFHLEDVTFSVEPGEVVGYLGHNGAGKTTTFRTMADLIRPREGTVRVGTLDHRRDERDFKQVVCFVGENRHVYDRMRVRDVLQLAARLYPGWDHEWCAQTCAHLRLPLEARAKHLSTGMRTKLSLVLGLSPRPRFVVMDEPTSALDVASASWVWQHVDAEVAAGRLGVLVSSHSQEEVMTQCTRVVVLEEGRIVERIDLLAERERALDSVAVAMGRSGDRGR